MSYPLPQTFQQQVSNLRFTKFLIVETGTYNQQYLRPYETDLRRETLGQLKEITSQSPTVTASTLSGIANQFIRPTASPESRITIQHGWEQKRYRYLLEMQYESGGVQHVDLIMGYSEYDGIGHTGSIDEQMRFFVNSIVNQRVGYVMTATGNTPFMTSIKANHVLTDPSWVPNKSMLHTHANMFHLRPQDVYSSMSVASMADSLGASNILDARIHARNEAVLSNRSNNVASQYAANMIRAYANSVNSVGMGTEEELHSNALGMVRDDLTSQNTFLSRLHKLQGTNTAAFTLDDLRSIDKSIDYVKRVVHMSAAQKAAELHVTGQTAAWHSSDGETNYATILGQSVPALLMQFGLTQARFVSTNNNITALPMTNMLHAQSFSGGDVTRPVEHFKQRFDIELIKDLTYDNSIQYYFECDFDLLGESKIKLSLNGGPLIDYVVPSFADAILSPLSTYKAERTHGMALQFGDMLSNLGYGQMEYGPSSYQPVEEHVVAQAPTYVQPADNNTPTNTPMYFTGHFTL